MLKQENCFVKILGWFYQQVSTENNYDAIRCITKHYRYDIHKLLRIFTQKKENYDDVIGRIVHLFLFFSLEVALKLA